MAKIAPGRGLDHAVHVVRELDAAAVLYERAGFQVGARNKHPWGTHNRLIQFPNFFVEILTIAEPEKIPEPTARVFSWGAFNRDYLARQGEGLSGLVLEGHNVPKEQSLFDAAGFSGFEPLNFSRTGKRADGSETEVGFSIAFVKEPASPNVIFYTCKQTHPENFWSGALQKHPNGADSIRSVVFAADNPTDHHIVLSTVTGVRDIQASSRGISIQTPRGRVEALDPRAFKDTFGVEAERDPGLNMAALVFGVRDFNAAGNLLQQSGLKFRQQGERLVIGPDEARGAVLAFEQS